MAAGDRVDALRICEVALVELSGRHAEARLVVAQGMFNDTDGQIALFHCGPFSRRRVLSPDAATKPLVLLMPCSLPTNPTVLSTLRGERSFCDPFLFIGTFGRRLRKRRRPVEEVGRAEPVVHQVDVGP